MNDSTDSEDSDDDSLDDSFRFSRVSADFSTTVSSPTSNGDLNVFGGPKTKHQSIDSMTGLRDWKGQKQGRPRTKTDARRLSGSLLDFATKKSVDRTSEISHTKPRPGLGRRSSTDTDALISWRSSVTAVEALEQEYIRKLEHLRREEIRQLDQRLREAEQYERERKRERERQSERQEQEREREREKQRERDRLREWEREMERSGWRRPRSRSVYSERSPRPHGRRCYGDGY